MSSSEAEWREIQERERQWRISSHCYTGFAPGKAKLMDLNLDGFKRLGKFMEDKAGLLVMMAI